MYGAPKSDKHVLVVHHDARFECSGAVAEMKDGEARFLLRYGTDMLTDNQIKASLTEHEAVALAAVLNSAIHWFRSVEKEAV